MKPCCCLPGLLFVFAVMCDLAPGADAASSSAIVIDDSQFWDRMPVQDNIGNATSLKVPWLFNNTALLLRERANVETTATIPTAGTYHLFARAMTGPGERNAFRVALGTQVSPYVTGDATFAWRRVGAFELPAGPQQVRITRINTTPMLDALVLTQDQAWTDAGIEARERHPEVVVLREYAIPEALSVNLGDADNDGLIDLLVMRPNYSASIIGSDGKTLWTYETPADVPGADGRTTDDINGLIWDLDGDGRSEVLHWRFLDGRETLVVADGRTGEIKASTPWPIRALPHPYNNNRISIARFGPGRASHVLVYSDGGGTITINAYTATLQLAWSHTARRLKDHYGHFVHPVDLDGDGIDEVVASALVLDAQGRERWNRYDVFDDHHDHFDQIRFADLDGDGKAEIVAPQSDVGISAFDAATGRMLWWTQAEHTQRLAIGDFLDGQSAPVIAGSARIYGNRVYEPYLWAQVHWLDAKGTLLAKWPENPLNCNPVFVNGDWRGDGGNSLFWHQFHLTRRGVGELYFTEEVYQMSDLLGDRAEEVVALGDGVLRIYGWRGANHTQPKFSRDEEYLRRRLANHDH